MDGRQSSDSALNDLTADNEPNVCRATGFGATARCRDFGLTGQFYGAGSDQGSGHCYSQSRYKGKVLSADLEQKTANHAYRIKLLTDKGREDQQY